MDWESKVERMNHVETVITELNNLWDQAYHQGIPRQKVECTWELDGMDFSIGELRVPFFYFHLLKVNEFWHRLNCLLNCKVQSMEWLKAIIKQAFSRTMAWVAEVERMSHVETVMRELNSHWDLAYHPNIPRRRVEFTWVLDGMDFSIGELRVPFFYFHLLNVNEFWQRLNCLLKCKVQSMEWLKAIIKQTF